MERNDAIQKFREVLRDRTGLEVQVADTIGRDGEPYMCLSIERGFCFLNVVIAPDGHGVIGFGNTDPECKVLDDSRCDFDCFSPEEPALWRMIEYMLRIEKFGYE